MVKHTQTLCRLLPTNCLTVFDHFVGIVIKGLIWKESDICEIFKNTYFEEHLQITASIFSIWR